MLWQVGDSFLTIRQVQNYCRTTEMESGLDATAVHCTINLDLVDFGGGE